VRGRIGASIAVYTLSSVTAGAWARQEPPAFPSQVNLVLVDVVVTDNNGHPVPNLTRSDFAVTEERRAQTILSYRAVGSTEAGAASEDRMFDEGRAGREAGQTFLIIFDDVHIEAPQTTPAQAAIERFVTSGVARSDTVVLLAPAAGVEFVSGGGADRAALLESLRRLRGMKIIDPCQRLTEFEAMRISVLGSDTVSVARPSSFREHSACPSGGSLDAHAIHQDAQRRDSITLGAVSRALSVIGSGEGKRSAILMSGGFVDDPSLNDAFRRVLQASLGSQAALYFGCLKAETIQSGGSFDP
jgi:VWFA-related protein